LISKQQRDKNKACFVEGWDVIPKQNAKFHNNMIDNSSPFLTQLFLQYLYFAKQFRSLIILRMFWRQNDRWQAPSQIPLVFCSPTSRLDSCNCSIEMAEDPTMTSHLLFGLYHLENGGCMGSVRVRQKSGIWQMLVNKPTWQRNVYLWQRPWSSWYLSETWLGKITEVSQLRVIFWFNSLHSSGIHGKTFNPSLLHSSLNSFDDLHNIMSFFQCCCGWLRVGKLPPAR
jgi:hypothetical protein